MCIYTHYCVDKMRKLLRKKRVQWDVLIKGGPVKLQVIENYGNPDGNMALMFHVLVLGRLQSSHQTTKNLLCHVFSGSLTDVLSHTSSKLGFIGYASVSNLANFVLRYFNFFSKFHPFSFHYLKKSKMCVTGGLNLQFNII